MGGYWYVDSQPYSAVLDALIAASNSSQIVLTTGTYSDPGFIASLAASKITGTLAKSQQHAQTAYKDEANTWAQAQTFNGAIGFKEDVWSISNADSARRLFFQNNSTTYIAGNGSNPVQLRNGSEQPLVSFNSNFETIFHSTGWGSSGSIYAGSATFTGPTQINGAAGGASTYLQLLNNGSAIAILGSDTSISGGNAADVGLFVHGDNELCLWVNSTRMVRVSDSGSTFNGASTFTGNISAASGLAVSGKIQISNNGSSFGSTLSNGSSQFYNNTTLGLVIAGAGSTSDLTVTNKAGGEVFNIPTGTTSVYFPATEAHIGYGGNSNYFGGATYFRPVAGGDYTAYVNGANGDALFEGVVTAQSGRPVKTYFGYTTYYGDAGGYLIGSRFRGPSDTDLGVIGALGTGDTLYSYIIGEYGDEIVTFDNVTKATTFNGAATFTSTAKLGDYTVATLPSAASNTGHECNATDSSVTTFGSTVAGGGSNNVKVRSNGTNWTVTGI